MKIKLILADDHPALIAGIKHELSSIHTLEVIGTARNSSEIVEILSASSCDILVTDYSMPGGEFGDGIAMLSFLRRRYPDLKIIVFTTIGNSALIAEMNRMGVGSILNKSHDVGHLISAIHSVYAGAPYFTTSTSPAVLSATTVDRKNAPSLRDLTKRETEVLRLYLSGLSINEIAAQLHRTKQTVSAQKTGAMRKLGAKSEVDLFLFAHEMGMPDDARRSRKQ
ncbi:response regulator transcription factor [Burkholderia pyrrocinia]|uniref:response regulator transcription factor n=1 Tax=Burkholderia pyrrocinia TaxID=60550 RepID=UPI0010501F20|nr:response regulator transcription factor [Burkholderia pyrrocinia]TDA47885.1 response regulator transcription factor [Burkholderia pyrrocinia]